MNTITEVTKLLLKSCNCNNCSFSVDSNMGSDWCMHRKEKPKDEVCVMWKEQLTQIKEFVKWAKEEFPNALPGKNSFLFASPKLNSTIRLISELY